MVRAALLTLDPRWKKVEGFPGVPRDAVIEAESAYRRCMFFSRRSHLAVKCVIGEDRVQRLRTETSVLASIGRTSASDLVPELVAWACEDDRAWSAQVLVGGVFGRREDLGPRAWSESVVPRLTRIWDALGPTEASTTTLLERVVGASTDMPDDRDFAEATLRVATLHDQVGERRYVEVMTHGDLHSRHVHRDGGQIKLIDWDAAARRPYVADLLRIATPQELFQAPGPRGVVRDDWRPVFQVAADWAMSHGTEDPSPDSLRLMLTLALLDRSATACRLTGRPLSAQPRTTEALAILGV
jgi:hypothetical protein